MTLIESLYDVYSHLYDIWIDETENGTWPEEDLETMRELRIDVFNLIEYLNRDRAERYNYPCP